jgi:hypothetical protein
MEGLGGFTSMIDRQKVETILRRRFPGADWDQIAAATNAILGLGDEWQEVRHPDLTQLDGQLDGAEFRVFCRAAANRDS